jgi:hypothetical protein
MGIALFKTGTLHLNTTVRYAADSAFTPQVLMQHLQLTPQGLIQCLEHLHPDTVRADTVRARLTAPNLASLLCSELLVAMVHQKFYLECIYF